MCALDTRLTLCCSVRQPPLEIQAGETCLFRIRAVKHVKVSQAKVSQTRGSASMVTIRDVAKESGFSSTTVSIVLNDAPLACYIPAATKKRIERAAKKLGYRPN